VFGIGWTEFIVIALVVLVFVGPRNLPPLLRKLGSIMTEFKAASRELRDQIDAEVKDLDISPRKMARDIEKQVLEEVGKPYEELRQADRELRKDLKRTEREIHGDLAVKEVRYDPRLVGAVADDGPGDGEGGTSAAAPAPAPDGVDGGGGEVER